MGFPRAGYGWPWGAHLTPYLSSYRLYALLSSRAIPRDFTINTGSDLPLGLAVLGHDLGRLYMGPWIDPVYTRILTL